MITRTRRRAAIALLGLVVALGTESLAGGSAFDEEMNPGKPTCSLCSTH